MTLALSGEEIAKQVEKEFPGCVAESTSESLLVKAESLLEVAAYLRDTPALEFDYLSSVTAVDYFDCFEAVYHLTSIKRNHSLVLKTRCYGRENPALPLGRSEIIITPGPARVLSLLCRCSIFSSIFSDPHRSPERRCRHDLVRPMCPQAHR